MFFSCSKNEKEVNISFYHWKSTFNPTQKGWDAVKGNNCHNLYIRYFDIVKEEGLVKPVAIVNTLPETSYTIVPVIYIENAVFKGIDKKQADTIFDNTLRLLKRINILNKTTTYELQVDCDWTEQTKDIYFYFLKKFKQEKIRLSATIRLHQVKYSSITGIPPVDKGVLMYYNMGKIDAGSPNSIYDKNTAQKYVHALKTYTLPLDVALPIFSWGVQTRAGKVVELVNKTNEQNFLNDTCFTSVSNFIFEVKSSCFKGGYYFQKGDRIKVESVTGDQLEEIGELLAEKMKQKPSEIIFYDLDTINLKRYNENIFKKVRDHFN